jgi:O-methyltransferase
MVPTESLTDLAHLVRAVLWYDIPGHFVECGVWRGGASFLMADLLRQAGIRNRKVWLIDSFEGLPPPEEIDGVSARAYAENTKSPAYFDNCRASLEEVQQNAIELGLAPYTEFVKGWFNRTLPVHRKRIGPIAILRIDGDWYSSVRCCLDNLYNQVVDEGYIVLDDYYTYEGCAIAVHEFLGARRLGHSIEGVVSRRDGVEDYQSALFRKGQPTWKWARQEYLAAEEISALIPGGETLIIIGQDGLSNGITGAHRAFLERNGEDYGPPEDDITAIRELNRLRWSRARFLVFAWPAFWWLDYYADFHRHLRERFRCVLENERLVIFDLRAKAAQTEGPQQRSGRTGPERKRARITERGE